MVLNRSPKFKSSNPKPSAAKHFGAEAIIRANSEELYYAILDTKFQASEPSVSETEDFFHTAYVFLCFKPRRKSILDPLTLV